ncbi:MAG: T9SS type A sorting domain-containing protein [Crocinitomicaceae bacterium]
MNQAQLDLSEFAHGIYFLEIQSENGSETVKLLKQ